MEAAIISASVSLLIFVVSQWLLFAKEAIQVRRQKLEELWECLDDYIANKVIGDVNDETERNSYWFVKRSRRISEGLTKAHMLCSLYFHEVMPKFEELHSNAQRLAKSVEKIARLQYQISDVMEREESPIENRTPAEQRSDGLLRLDLENEKEVEFKTMDGHTTLVYSGAVELQNYFRENQETLLRTVSSRPLAWWERLRNLSS